MKKIKNEELKKISGGTTTYTTAINTLIKAISTLFSIGQALGSTIARSINGKQCII